MAAFEHPSAVLVVKPIRKSPAVDWPNSLTYMHFFHANSGLGGFEAPDSDH